MRPAYLKNRTKLLGDGSQFEVTILLAARFIILAWSHCFNRTRHAWGVLVRLVPGLTVCFHHMLTSDFGSADFGNYDLLGPQAHRLQTNPSFMRELRTHFNFEGIQCHLGCTRVQYRDDVVFWLPPFPPIDICSAIAFYGICSNDVFV